MINYNLLVIFNVVKYILKGCEIILQNIILWTNINENEKYHKWFFEVGCEFFLSTEAGVSPEHQKRGSINFKH